MIHHVLRKILLVLTWPIRFAIRHELKDNAPNFREQDLKLILQRRAAESSADYVVAHMKNVDSTTSRAELLTLAMSHVDLVKNPIVCEFGVFTGNTINHIASIVSGNVYGFDSFEGLPERWRDGYTKGAFKVNALPSVRSNVTLIKGWFDQTLPPFIQQHKDPIGLLHIDCDLYSSTKIIFDQLAPQIHPGCVIVFDEYFNYPGWEEGEYKAFQEYLEVAGLGYDYIGYNCINEQVAVKITSL
jgi:predicted O-methyltransferase YrrM